MDDTVVDDTKKEFSDDLLSKVIDNYVEISGAVKTLSGEIGSDKRIDRVVTNIKALSTIKNEITNLTTIENTHRLTDISKSFYAAEGGGLSDLKVVKQAIKGIDLLTKDSESILGFFAKDVESPVAKLGRMVEETNTTITKVLKSGEKQTNIITNFDNLEKITSAMSHFADGDTMKNAVASINNLSDNNIIQKITDLVTTQEIVKEDVFAKGVKTTTIAARFENLKTLADNMYGLAQTKFLDDAITSIKRFAEPDVKLAIERVAEINNGDGSGLESLSTIASSIENLTSKVKVESAIWGIKRLSTITDKLGDLAKFENLQSVKDLSESIEGISHPIRISLFKWGLRRLVKFAGEGGIIEKLNSHSAEHIKELSESMDNISNPFKIAGFKWGLRSLQKITGRISEMNQTHSSHIVELGSAVDALANPVKVAGMRVSLWWIGKSIKKLESQVNLEHLKGIQEIVDLFSSPSKIIKAKVALMFFGKGLKKVSDNKMTQEDKMVANVTPNAPEVVPSKDESIKEKSRNAQSLNMGEKRLKMSEKKLAISKKMKNPDKTKIKDLEAKVAAQRADVEKHKEDNEPSVKLAKGGIVNSLIGKTKNIGSKLGNTGARLVKRRTEVRVNGRKGEVGESGPEAVIPLKKIPEVAEKMSGASGPSHHAKSVAENAEQDRNQMMQKQNTLVDNDAVLKNRSDVIIGRLSLMQMSMDLLQAKVDQSSQTTPIQGAKTPDKSSFGWLVGLLGLTGVFAKFKAFREFMGKTKDVMVKIWNGLKSAAKFVAEKYGIVKTFIIEKMDAFKTFVREAPEKIKASIAEKITSVRKFFGESAEILTKKIATVKEFFGNGVKFVTDKIDTIKNFFDDGISMIKTAIVEKVNVFKTALADFIPKITNTATQFATKIWGIVKTNFIGLLSKINIPMVGNLGKMVSGKVTSEVVEKGTKEVAEKASTKIITKLGSKALMKSVLKKIPVVGLLAGLGFGAQRAMAGDWLGAGGEILSGAASLIPGAGTAASVAIDAAMISRDIYNSSNEKTPIESDGVRKMATGGIVTKPTLAMIGEANESEAVIPLEDGFTIFGDRLYDHFVEKSRILDSQPIPSISSVDGIKDEVIQNTENSLSALAAAIVGDERQTMMSRQAEPQVVTVPMPESKSQDTTATPSGGSVNLRSSDMGHMQTVYKMRFGI